MALSGTTHFVMKNGGSDTANSGAFDPGQTAGMFTDGAATLATSTAPVFTSASYNFVAGDVGARVFIGAGTNWRVGWYTIVSVAANAATLNATHEQYSLYPVGISAFDGCASVASPTGATWSIDYSLMPTRRIAFTDLASAGAGLTASSAGNPIGKQMVGNSILISAGTNFTAGLYVLASVAASVGTFLGAANMTTGAGSGGTGGMGGAFATLGQLGVYHVAGNLLLAQYNATPFTSTNTTNNTALGRMTMVAGAAGGYTILRGFDVAPGDQTANRPEFKWGVNGASNFLVTGTSRTSIQNLIFNGNRANFTNVGAFTHGGGQGIVYRVKIMGCSVATTFGSVVVREFEMTDCTQTIAMSTGLQSFSSCYFHDNTVTPISWTTGTFSVTRSIFDTNGAAGISVGGACVSSSISGCTFYGNTGPGIALTSAPISLSIENNIFEANTTYGITLAGTYGGVFLQNNAYYNNPSGQVTAGTVPNYQNLGAITYTSTAFVDGPNADFRLNSAAGRALNSAGAPAAFPGLSWANYQGLGASRNKALSGGGGYFNPF